ncbi:hypothetical protein Tco_0884463 [Tanacetum coccineum]
MSHSMKLLRHLWNVHKGTSSLLKRTSLEKEDMMIKILLLLPQKTQIKAKKTRHDSDASGSKQSPAPQASVWKTTDTRDAPSSSSKQQSEDIPRPDTVNISDSEDTGSAHLLKIKPRPEWLKPIPEEDKPESPEPD